MNKKIIRYALYGIEIMICFALQVTPAALPEVFGGKAVLLLSLALSFGVFEKELPAMLLAVVCGFLTDCAYSGTVGFYVIMLVIACFTISLLFQEYFRKSMLTVMLTAFAAVPVILILQFLIFYVSAGYPDRWYMFFHHYFFSSVCTLMPIPVMYWVNGFVFRKTAET